MKYLFVIQGEGRGHFTQALSLKAILEHNGHAVVAVMVGGSAKRTLPSFFSQKIDSEIIQFQSPNFLPTPRGKHSPLLISILYNLLFLPVYVRSVLKIRRTIRSHKRRADFSRVRAGPCGRRWRWARARHRRRWRGRARWRRACDQSRRGFPALSAASSGRSRCRIRRPRPA
jgi:hypothetical protein